MSDSCQDYNALEARGGVPLGAGVAKGHSTEKIGGVTRAASVRNGLGLKPSFKKEATKTKSGLLQSECHNAEKFYSSK